jgi:hypothetical protein
LNFRCKYFYLLAEFSRAFKYPNLTAECLIEFFLVMYCHKVTHKLISLIGFERDRHGNWAAVFEAHGVHIPSTFYFRLENKLNDVANTDFRGHGVSDKLCWVLNL